MALSNLHTTGWTYGSYEADRNIQIKLKENPDLYNHNTNLNAHSDGNNSIAFGYGYDLFQNVNRLTVDLTTTYVSAVQPNTTLAQALTSVINLINSYHNGTYTILRNGVRVAGGINDLATEINTHITLTNEANATNLLNNTLVPRYENMLTERLATRDIVLADSKERLALFDMVYNGGSGLIGDGLLTALENNNRAEAWYEIRYNSNWGNSRTNVGLGIANRRVAESNMFGLYSSDFNNLSEEEKTLESKTIFRMYTLHKGYAGNDVQVDGKYTILGEESQFGSYSGNNSFTSQSATAKDYLETNFAEGVTIDGDVLVGKGLEGSAYIDVDPADYNLRGTANNDLIFGENGSDFIYGGAGNDVIYGGKGLDELHGGEGDDYLFGEDGDDTYVIEVPNELAHNIDYDIIEDTSGTDTIIFKDRNTNDIARVLCSKENNNLEIIFQGGSKVTINDWYDKDTGRIEKFIFEDKTITDHEIISYMGTDQEDYIRGTEGQNKLEGKEGKDILEGGAGNDLYIVNNGDIIKDDKDFNAINKLSYFIISNLSFKNKIYY